MQQYPPESTWNDPPTDAQVGSIIKAGTILGIEYTEMNLPPTRWEARDLQNTLWEQVKSKGKKTTIAREVNMETKIMGSCGNCGYPITASHSGQEVTCPNCSSINQAVMGVTIPWWLVTLGIGLFVGVIAGPAMLASTEGGGRWLKKQVDQRVG